MRKVTNKQPKSLKRVLLVEDNKDVNDAFATLLRAAGYDVRQVYNGQEAIDVIPGYKPEILLLDLLMPIMDGNEFLRVFENDTQIPIIVFSNLDSRSEVRDALENGATRYMLKSWATPEELFRVIDDAV